MFRANSLNSRIIIIIQLILAAAGGIYLVINFKYWFLLAILLWFIFLLHWCHHVGLHRYFSHNSFSVNKFWHIVICFTSCLVTFGSPVGYTIAHRTHHKYSDTDKDPHSPKFIGKLNTIIFNWDISNSSILYANGLKDKIINFTHEYYILIPLSFYVTLLFLNVELALTYNVGVALAWLAVGYVNTYNHLGNFISYKNFNTKDGSFNDIIAGWIGGEWHNNHHRYPGNYSEKIKWWEFDFPSIFIKAIKK